jgi:hypothetical protein
VAASRETLRARERDRKRAWRAKGVAENPRFLKEMNLRQKYGMTLEQWDEMFLRQDGRCAICEEAAELHVDHCHQSGRVRELLCTKCNLGIGCFVDDPNLLASASRYAEKWKD